MINCFLCQADITDKTKVLSYHCFPDSLWNEAGKNWAEDFKKLFNGVLCSDCAKKDLEVAHESYKLQHAEYKQKIEKLELDLAAEKRKKRFALFARF